MKVRRHGCEAPLHPSQVAVVLVASLSAVVFYVSVQELPMRRTIELLFAVQFSVTTCLFIIISRFDPSYKQQEQPMEGIIESVGKDATGLLPSHAVGVVCQECGLAPLTTDTRHCGRCNKCVPGYDHHCIYLNTCIGTRNYSLFVGLLSCTILLLVTQQIVTGYAISRLFSDEARHSTNSSRAMWLCAISLLPMLELVFLVVLGSFHLYIAFLGLTTYEWLYRWLERRNEGERVLDSN